MRAGQYSARLSGLRHVCEAVQEGPRLVHRGGLLKRLAKGLVGAEPLEIPGVELAQVAPGARAAEGLDGAVHDPVELGEDLDGARAGVPLAQQLGEQPRVAERAA